MSRYVTFKKRLQGRLCKTLKRCKYDSVVACEQALCLGKEFAPRPKDCSQVTTLGLLMIASPILCTTHISKFVRPHEKRQSGVFKNMHSEDRFQKTCVFCAPKRLFCVAFAAPNPPRESGTELILLPEMNDFFAKSTIRLAVHFR